MKAIEARTKIEAIKEEEIARFEKTIDNEISLAVSRGCEGTYVIVPYHMYVRRWFRIRTGPKLQEIIAELKNRGYNTRLKRNGGEYSVYVNLHISW